MARWLAALLVAVSAAEAAVVVLDRHTGKVLHREGAVNSMGEPGSVLKPFVLLALNQAPALGCQRTLRLQGRNFNCAHPDVGRPLTPVEALAYSCNQWFARSALRVAPRDIASQLARAGFSRVRIPGGTEERQLQAIGQWGVSTSPLEIARAYRWLAALKDPVAEEALRAAVTYGTARLAAVGGMDVLGKTGTAGSGQAWFAGFTPDLVVVVRLERGTGGSGAAPVAAQYFRRFAGNPALLQVREGNARVAMTLEDYVALAVAGEASGFRSLESLKAMAVAVRSFARKNPGRHKSEGFDFCDSTHCQHLAGSEPSASIRAAVEATEAETLWYDGSPAAVFYHRHCGGRTEAAGDVWPDSARPYLRSVPDPFCLSNGSASWQARIPASDIAKALGSDPPSPLVVLDRTASGRVRTLQAGPRRLSAEQFHVAIGRVLGWQLLKSSWYDLQPSGDGYLFSGKGGGHGVGLCQLGAAARGEQGQDYRQILAAYFPKTKVGINAQGITWERRDGERVEVFATGAPGDEMIPALADDLLAAAERVSGLSVTKRPRVVVYPAVRQFSDSTGEPGWVAGSTQGNRIRLQPAATLNHRGVLREVLLHEFMHVALNENTRHAVPEWFDEGLALTLSGTSAGDRLGHREAKVRVSSLIRQFGRETVLGWLRTGVPEGAGHPGSRSR